jgi:radical SAM protein with 4Fe4S-binding SPASM domain
MEAGLDSLKFSLNCADEMQYSEITGMPKEMFQKVVQNIKDAYSVREKGNYKCGLYASFIKYDGEQENMMHKVIQEVKPYLDEFYSLPLYNQSAKISNNDWEFSSGNRGRYQNQVEALPCWALFKEGHINFDGTLNACCFAVDDAFIMGNLNTQGFMDAWNCKKFQELRRASLNKNVKNTACEKCVCGRNS